ncbi:carboxymuconolactone decarboxylase family protein [Actinoplanes sp. DH11]|uniref:carboxymuconolactone decarboxylase family protein n=1 Tax=Actinoplanes sp. DH11 TaxID=2857011 RepID=UPI001E3CA554|nr:carboxymuconolactone decarboxylase family protein [Actinoplanes sp. DH11]
MTYRFFTPAPPRAATGRTAQVYQQLREDFLGPAPTFQALSPAPELLAATWALTREALIADVPHPAHSRADVTPGTSRVEREIVAAAVSRANHCRFCLDAHATLLHALGAHEPAEAMARGGIPQRPDHAELTLWAEASRSPRASGWTGRYGPHHVGTLLAFHFINRVVSALLMPDLLPGGLQRLPAVRAAGGRLYARATRKSVDPGRSLPLIGVNDGDNDPVTAAWTALRNAATGAIDLLGPEARQTVEATVRWEDGRHPSQPREWAEDLIRDLPTADRPGARIALLAAFAPDAITLGDVGLWRLSHPADADLVRIVAFGAFTATDHVARAADPHTAEEANHA